MSISIELNMHEGLIRQARQMGLADNRPVADLLADEVCHRNAGQELKNALDEIRSTLGEPLTTDQINAEIKPVRAERRAREARH